MLMPEGLVLVLSGFPRRSETFAMNEAFALLERRKLAAIFTLKDGDGLPPHTTANALLPVVTRLLPGSPGTQSAEMIRRLRGKRVTGVHGYFAHTPADVAETTAKSLGVGFGFSCHAKDARKVPPAVLLRRGRAARCVIACNADVAETLRDHDVEAHLIPHGVDLTQFVASPVPPGSPLRLLAIGRLVEKKGFHLLLHAVALLKDDWNLVVVGEGPEQPALEGLARSLGIHNRIRFAGSVTHQELPSIYRAAQVVVVPSIEDGDGDRDGLPNVILEAMAAGRPVVASDISAISQAVLPGNTGLLVPPGDVSGLSDALATLAHQPLLIQSLGAAAHHRACAEYELNRCTTRLARVLEASYASH